MVRWYALRIRRIRMMQRLKGGGSLWECRRVTKKNKILQRQRQTLCRRNLLDKAAVATNLFQYHRNHNNNSRTTYYTLPHCPTMGSHTPWLQCHATYSQQRVLTAPTRRSPTVQLTPPHWWPPLPPPHQLNHNTTNTTNNNSSDFMSWLTDQDSKTKKIGTKIPIESWEVKKQNDIVAN